MVFPRGCWQSVSATATCTGIASPSGWGETVWWEPPSATRHSCPSIWWRTSITPTGPARRATSRQPLAAAAFLGVALTASADDVHLQEAYGVFAAEARD